MDSNLNWNAHIESVAGKLRSGLYALNRTKNLLSSDLLRLMYYGLFHCHIQYGIALWGSASTTSLAKLLVLQKKALRSVFHTSLRASTSELFIRAGILKIYDVYKKECLKISFRYVNGTLPMPLTKFFQTNNAIHAYNTRQADRPHIQRFRYSTYRNSFIHQGPTLWACLPDHFGPNTSWATIVSHLWSNLSISY